MTYTILIVEDEFAVADHLSRILTSFGYQCLEPVGDFTSAREVLCTQSPDIAILDIHLGGKLTGIDLGQYLYDHHAIPFLYLTAFGDDDTIEKAKLTKPSGYLMKPFKKQDLKPAIEIALSNYHSPVDKDRKEMVQGQWNSLTQTEKEVVKRISMNLTSKQLAEELFLSAITIKNHRHRICGKLGLAPTNNSLLTWVLENKTFFH